MPPDSISLHNSELRQRTFGGPVHYQYDAFQPYSSQGVNWAAGINAALESRGIRISRDKTRSPDLEGLRT